MNTTGLARRSSVAVFMLLRTKPVGPSYTVQVMTSPSVRIGVVEAALVWAGGGVEEAVPLWMRI